MSHQKLLTKLEGFRSRNSQNHCTSTKMSIVFYMTESSTTSPTTISNPMMVLKPLAAMVLLCMDSAKSGLMNSSHPLEMKTISLIPTELPTFPRRTNRCVS